MSSTVSSTGDGSVPVLAEAYRAIDALVAEAHHDAFDRPTGCAAFRVRDLLFHLMLDAQRALVGLADPREETPDTDATAYWQRHVSGTDPARERGHVAFVQRAALAYGSPRGLVAHWSDVSGAAVAAGRHADPSATVATQGCLLTVADLVDTLVVEATLHHADLAVGLAPGTPVPPGAGALTRRRVEALLGQSLPPEWDDATALARTTGRAEVGEETRRALGAAATRLPVIR